MNAQLLQVKEVARLLKISVRQVWKLTASGKLPNPVRIAGSVRWRESDIEAWIQGGCNLHEGVKL
jgi:excisionase family DNA binding protein